MNFTKLCTKVFWGNILTAILNFTALYQFN